MDNLTAGNPRAHAVRVYFEGETTIYEGMPVCYNYDTTDNWFGGSVANTGEVTASTTTADGLQNEGKYIRVERVSDSNLLHFAGVVKRGGWVGKTGPKVLDIYVPNGAIVPVRCDVDCTSGRTVLSIQANEEELGYALDASEARPVAIAMETETGLDTTPDITLAKLCPDEFIYQDFNGSSLLISSGTTPAAASQVVNRIHVSTAQTAGQFSAMRIYADVDDGGIALSYDYGLALYVQSTYKSGCTFQSATTAGFWMNIDSGANTTGTGAGGHVSVIQAGIYQAGDDPWEDNQVTLSVMQLNLQIEDDPGNNCLNYIRMRNDGAHAIDGIFSFPSNASCGYAASSATVNGTIPFLIGNTVFYFICSTTA